MATVEWPGAGDTVRQAMYDLRAAGRKISSHVLVEVTGLPRGIVDYHVSRMLDFGEVRRLARDGVVELVDVFRRSRTISRTALSDGWTLLELGETKKDKADEVVIHLTPGEARELGKMFYADVLQLAQLTTERESQDTLARLERQSAETKHRLATALARIDDLTKDLIRLRNQRELAFE